MSQSEQFMLRKETFGPDQLDDQGRLAEYRQQVAEMITPKLAAVFEEQTRRSPSRSSPRAAWSAPPTSSPRASAASTTTPPT